MTAINADTRRNAGSQNAGSQRNEEMWLNAELRWSEDIELDLGPRVRVDLIVAGLLLATLLALILAAVLG